MWPLPAAIPPLPAANDATVDRIRRRYECCRELTALNNECLEIITKLQEDLEFAPPRQDLFGVAVAGFFARAGGIVDRLECLTGRRQPSLRKALAAQQQEIERDMAARLELLRPRLSAGLAEIRIGDAPEVGDKAAALGDIRATLGLPVPAGYVLTTEAYRDFFGVPYWGQIRDAIRSIHRGTSLAETSAALTALVLAAPLPHALRVALEERGRALAGPTGLAIRSSAVGEGGPHSFAGQFETRLNVPVDQLAAAYRATVASRFSERALAYRLSSGLSEVETPMAVLVLTTVAARASGILYTRDPSTPRARTSWITSSWGLGLDAGDSAGPGDMIIVDHACPHRVLERRVARKPQEIALNPAGGVMAREVSPERADSAALQPGHLETLVGWGLAIERRFGAPQDIEWALDDEGQLWILQARPLTLAGAHALRTPGRVKQAPILEGGRPVYPGRVSGLAYLVDADHALDAAPDGAVVVVRRAAPDIVKICARAAGVVAESGNLAGHAAALLREFKVPSVFEMPDASARLTPGATVSLDAVHAAVYSGELWRARPPGARHDGGPPAPAASVVRRRLLALSLHDPSSFRFRPSGCRSAHDVIRYCHEKGIEAMFSLNDGELGSGAYRARRLMSPAPVDLHVLDLGGGMTADPGSSQVAPDEIRCRPFRALWRGVTHPGVTWRREMPASFGGLMSVVAGSLTSGGSGPQRALGEKSYLLITSDYMDLNSRLAYHFTLVDAMVGDAVPANYVFFRFAGGGAARWRRNLRAGFLEGCLVEHGFRVDRRGDLINAWFKNAPPADVEAKLDVIGRLMACSSQLDMYMTSEATMRWYVEQFLAGNYAFAGHPR